MDKQSTLGILELNRREIQRNVHSALTVLEELNKAHGHETDADVQLSLQLSNSLAQFYFYGNYDACIDISAWAIEKFDAGDVYAIVMHLNLLGAAYTRLKKYQEAEPYFNQAINLARDEPSFANVLVNIYQQMTENNMRPGGNLDLAITYTGKSLELLHKYPKPVMQNRVYLQLGNIYCDKGDCNLAMEYFSKALDGFSEEFELLLMSLTCISMGRCYLKNNELEQAEKQLLEGLKLGDKAGQPENCAWNNIYLAQLYQKKNNMKDAITYATIALQLAKNINDNGLITEAERIVAAA